MATILCPVFGNRLAENKEYPYYCGMNALLEPLTQSPRLLQLVDELNRLVAEEQERRAAFYNAITEQDKAEFINGQPVMHSPVAEEHEHASSELFWLMRTWARLHTGGRVAHEKLMVRLTRNDFEPDICYFSPGKADLFTQGQKLFPAPDLAVEVLSPSTQAHDRGVKMEDYAAHGVQEYWLVDPRAESVEQYLLRDGGYELEFKGKTGDIVSPVIEGFSIPVQAIFNPALRRETLKKWQ